MSAFRNKRILLVEDEFIVAAMAEDMLTDLGATVVGPAGTVACGLSLAETELLDAALLDVNMDGERIDPVAEALMARRVPIVFATGYGAAGVGGAEDAPVLDKPYTQEALVLALSRAMNIQP
ncbi:MAG: response regulator [Alphaproteobacteria bacterium]|nr:response regulator [Alphaproteobacteria bacterium]